MIDAPVMPVAPPGRTRRLGRPRLCTIGDLPSRCGHWHAPRANRWEYVKVVAGLLETEWLGMAGIRVSRWPAGTGHWIAPGYRWRVPHMDADTRFELETHADETIAADAPQAVRQAMLDDLPVIHAEASPDVARVLADLPTGQLRLLRTRLDDDACGWLESWISDVKGFWHPLAPDVEGVVLVGRASHALGLPEYLGRDHLVIEAALAGTLRGDAEHARWLRNTLARHLEIEETLLFPAYLDAGGSAVLVHGLLKEHRQLREHLPHLQMPASRRRFLLLLDGHDEKEEQLVYPDILQRLGDRAGQLARAVMRYPFAGAALRHLQPEPGNDG